MRDYFIYMVMSDNKNALYIGVTNNLERRLYEHRNQLCDGFTKKYNCKNLVYFEHTNSVESAILREKQLKRWSRDKKIAIATKQNPDLRDLSTTLEMTDGEDI
jgi:putative endonuclease